LISNAQHGRQTEGLLVRVQPGELSPPLSAWR
jgi:hypothetical protein